MDKTNVRELQDVVIRFSGDSGDGMQLTGTLFSDTSALLGNGISTFPDYPAEIRAPQGTVAGVSGFQVHFGSHRELNPGDYCDVLVAMNPAALATNLSDLVPGGVLVINRDEFDEKGEPLPDEVRLTKVGKIVRSTSLDELPQLLNVLKGDMALIGPRPLLPQYLPLYNKEQRRRHEIRPGISGWAQCHGRNSISWTEKFKLDVWYVDHCSLITDIKVIFITIKKVLLRDGISQEGQATMELFNGNN